MLRRRYKAALFFLFVALGAITTAFRYMQTDKYELVSKIPLNGGEFITDNIQNTYIYSGSVLKKYDNQGRLLCQYDDKSYGGICYVDVNDPMKVMVFYRDFPELVFLDNTLSLNGSPINTSSMGFPLIALACVSHDNGAWLYDAQGYQLIRVDINHGVTQKTGNLIQALGMKLNPDYLLEYNSFVYLNDSANGILVFDQFGTYDKTIPIKGLATFQVRGNDLFYNKGNNIYAYHLKTITEDVAKAPDSLVSRVRVEKNMLFESCRDTLRIYRIK